MSKSALLEVRNLDKSFYATHAANNVSFSVNPGEVVALLGENGAGKSTILEAIAYHAGFGLEGFFHF